MNKKNIFSVLTITAVFCLLFAFVASAATFDGVVQRWQKKNYYTDDSGSNLTVICTYFSAEYIEAFVQAEAQKNMWTQQETDDYKYNFLKALQLAEMIPVNIKFINNGPTMHLGPFDAMIRLRIGNKEYKPVDYDKRFNFRFQGDKEGLVYSAPIK